MSVRLALALPLAGGRIQSTPSSRSSPPPTRKERPSSRFAVPDADDGKGAVVERVGIQVNVVAISGSLQRASSNSALLRAVGAAATNADFTLARAALEVAAGRRPMPAWRGGPPTV
jgi:hypothetical protein